MGTVHITLGRAGGKDGNASPLSLASDNAEQAATLNTTTTSQRVGSLEAVAGQHWTVVARGADIWVRFSANAVSNTAGPDNGHLVPAGAVREFIATPGWQVAARDA